MTDLLYDGELDVSHEERAFIFDKEIPLVET